MFTDSEILGAVVTVVLGLVTRWLWKKVPKLYKKLRYNMFGIGDLKEDIAAVSEQMKFVVAELKPNGGTSIRDCLNRIEDQQTLHAQRLKALHSDMDKGVFETDHEGEVQWVNRKYLRMTGRTEEEVMGSGWINTVAHRDRDRIVQAWNESINEEREFEEEYLMITPDDERLQVSAQTYKLVARDKSVAGFIGILTPLG